MLKRTDKKNDECDHLASLSEGGRISVVRECVPNGAFKRVHPRRKMRVPTLQRAATVPLATFAATHKASLLAQALLHGAVLLRGWPVDVHDLEGVRDALDLQDFPYVGGAAPRTRVAGSVLTANDAPPTEPIPFHHELAQARARPSHLLFYCDVPAEAGGTTDLVDSRALARYVAKEHPRVAARLDEGVRYTRVLPPVDDPHSPIGRSWRSTYDCTTRAQVEAKLRYQGTTFEWWDDVLWTRTAPLPAFRHEPVHGELVFSNALLAAHKGWTDARNVGTKSVSHADGPPVDAAFLDAVHAEATRLQYRTKWQRGDVLLVDNRVTMHARAPFEGPRRILTLLCAERESPPPQVVGGVVSGGG